tara:strand:+ start:116 stop:1834 length:1719 start_codon:yes stop_codon:yes gene_type:complete
VDEKTLSRRLVIIINGLLLASCTTGFFFLQDGQAHNFPSYLLTLVVLGFLIVQRHAFSELPKVFFSTLTLCLIYQGTTNFYSENGEARQLLTDLGAVVFILAFCVSLIYQVRSSRFGLDSVLIPVVLLATITLLAAITTHLHSHDYHLPAMLKVRLTNLGGRLENTAVTSLIMGSTLLMALSYTRKPHWGIRILAWFSVVIHALGLLLLQQRAPIVGLAVAGLYLCLPAYLQKAQVWIAIVLMTAFTLSSVVYFNLNSQLKQLTNTSQQSLPKPSYIGTGREDLVPRDQPPWIIPTLGQSDHKFGLVWDDIQVDPLYKYYLSFTAKSDKAFKRGFFVAVEQDPEQPHNSEVAADYVMFNEALTTAPVKRLTALPVQEGTQSINLLIMNWWNWDEIESANLTIDDIAVYRTDPGPADLIIHELSRINSNLRIFTFDTGERDYIWFSAIQSWLKSPLFGSGAPPEGTLAINGKWYEHYHSIYISTLQSSGIVGLTLLLGLVFYSIRENPSSGQLPSKIITALIIYGMIALIFDGGRVLTKINHLWLIFWLPLVLHEAFKIQSNSNHSSINSPAS